MVLFCTPRMILSCEGAWTTPAQFCRQCAAVRKMLLPIWEKRKFSQDNWCLCRPVWLRIYCTPPVSLPPSTEDPPMGDPWPAGRLSVENTLRLNHLGLNSSHYPSTRSDPTLTTLAARDGRDWQLCDRKVIGRFGEQAGSVKAPRF